MITLETKICTICGLEYEKGLFCSKKNWLKSKYCSIKCHNISTSNKMTGDKHYFWKGGEETRKKRNVFNQTRREIRKLENGGSHTLGEWENLKTQYNFTCPSCYGSEPEIQLTEDHIIPLSKGGSDNIENIQPLCKLCNCRKHTKIIKYEVIAN